MASLGYGPGAPHGTPKPPKAMPGGRTRKKPTAARALKTLQRSKKATAAGKPRRALRLKQRSERQLNRSVGKKPTKQFRNKQRAERQLQRSVSGRGGKASDALRTLQGKKKSKPGVSSLSQAYADSVAIMKPYKGKKKGLGGIFSRLRGNRGKPKNKSRRRGLIGRVLGKKSPFGAGGGMSKPKPKKRSSFLSRLTGRKGSIFKRKNKGVN
jgi:hypothetical protein